jgi:hypothetical protein
MTGFITSPETAQAVSDGVAQAFVSRDLPQFWALAIMPILSGEHEGQMFIAADDSIFQTPLMGSPVQRPTDYPEFETLVAMLGGLESRVDLDPAHITPPSDET